jgi:hypothetical protein
MHDANAGVKTSKKNFIAMIPRDSMMPMETSEEKQEKRERDREKRIRNSDVDADWLAFRTFAQPKKEL